MMFWTKAILPAVGFMSLWLLPVDTANAASTDAPDGIRHAVEISVGSDAQTEGPKRSSLLGTFSLFMRISSHSKLVDFSKTLTEAFDDVDLVKGTAMRKVWEESVCHERRGYPRIWLDEIRGVLNADGVKTNIDAVPRHLGMHLPPDELQLGQQVFANGDDLHQERVFRSKTLMSHLKVDVRLTSTACRM